jgi:hypothetical protein
VLRVQQGLREFKVRPVLALRVLKEQQGLRELKAIKAM